MKMRKFKVKRIPYKSLYHGCKTPEEVIACFLFHAKRFDSEHSFNDLLESEVITKRWKYDFKGNKDKP